MTSRKNKQTGILEFNNIQPKTYSLTTLKKLSANYVIERDKLSNVQKDMLEYQIVCEAISLVKTVYEYYRALINNGASIADAMLSANRKLKNIEREVLKIDSKVMKDIVKQTFDI